MTTTPAPSTEGPVFPRRSVIILSMVLTTLGFTLTSLFPYVGVMTKHLLGLSTTNEAGKLGTLRYAGKTELVVDMSNDPYPRLVMDKLITFVSIAAFIIRTHYLGVLAGLLDRKGKRLPSVEH